MVILYADSITPSMRRAMDETDRRRSIQDAFNKAHGIVPKTVKKAVRELMALSAEDKPDYNDKQLSQMTKLQRMEAIASLEKQMKEAAKMLEFEVAAALRDQIVKLRGNGK